MTDLVKMPFEIEKWLVTINAHCKVISSTDHDDDIGDCAAAIVRNVDNDLRPAVLALLDRIEALEKALTEACEEICWNEFNTGILRDGMWSHGSMSDAEALARDAGITSTWSNAEALKMMIPHIAERRAASTLKA